MVFLAGLFMSRAIRRATEPDPTRFGAGERLWLRKGGQLVSATVLSRHYTPRKGYVVEFYENMSQRREFISSRQARGLLRRTN